MSKPTTPKKTASKTTKPVAKKTVAKKAPAKKRTRNAKPLYAEVELGKLNELLGSDPKAKVTVSRNFVLALATSKVESDVTKSLGID